jgi:tetratricopeptide (TPR) repeat protein
LSAHPTPEEIIALCLGDLPSESKGKVALHLLQGCETCRALVPPPFDVFLNDRPTSRAEETACDKAITRAIRAALRRERHQTLQPDCVKAARALLDVEGLDGMDRANREHGEIAAYEALLAKSWSLRHEDPPRMVDFARAAVQVAQQLDATRYGPEWVTDRQCRAWAELGNAYRVAQQLDRARSCLRHAVGLLDLGTGDKGVEIRLLDLQASLAADRREFREACVALSFVQAFHSSRGDHHLAGRALVSKGLYTGYSGQYDQAIQLLKESLFLIDGDREPSLALWAVYNQLWFLVESGRFDSAKTFYFLNLKLLATLEGRVNLLKLEWLKGRIYAGLEEFVSAERVLREVKEGFLAADVRRPYDAAVASLDLAAVLLMQRQVAEARTHLREAAKTLVDVGLMREAERAVLLLRRAAEMEMEEAALLQLVLEITAFLRRAERDPHARFELP